MFDNAQYAFTDFISFDSLIWSLLFSAYQDLSSIKIRKKFSLHWLILLKGQLNVQVDQIVSLICFAGYICFLKSPQWPVSSLEILKKKIHPCIQSLFISQSNLPQFTAFLVMDQLIWSYRTCSRFTFSLEAKGTNPNVGDLNRKIYCSRKKILIISEIPWPSTKMNTYFFRLSRFQLISHLWYVHCIIFKGMA